MHFYKCFIHSEGMRVFVLRSLDCKISYLFYNNWKKYGNYLSLNRMLVQVN